MMFEFIGTSSCPVATCENGCISNPFEMSIQLLPGQYMYMLVPGTEELKEVQVIDLFENMGLQLQVNPITFLHGTPYRVLELKNTRTGNSSKDLINIPAHFEFATIGGY